MQDLEWMEFFTVHVIKFKTLSEALSMHDKSKCCNSKVKVEIFPKLNFHLEDHWGSDLTWQDHILHRVTAQ